MEDKNHKIKLKENIKISDLMAWEIEIDAIIFRDEFNYYLEKFKKDKSEKILVLDKMFSDKILVFVFIILQIYVEYFLHQNMRRIISLEFKNIDELKYKKWIKNEYRHISDKKTNKGKLFIFLEYFLLDSNPEAITIKEEIESVFNEITQIRNLLVHGHKISLGGNVDGSYEVSKTRGYLDGVVLMEIIENVNNLGKNWNKLLDLILDKCKTLERVDDFKFNSLNYE